MNLIISTITNSFYPNINKNPAFLTCPNGNIMIYELLQYIDLTHINNIYFIIYKDDFEEIFEYKTFISMFKNINKKFIINFIDTITNNYAETIYNCIKKYDIKGPCFIKDYKTFIKCCPVPGNYLYYVEYNNNTNISKINNKSFITFDNLNQIINISEKEIISNNISIGAYSFMDTNIFIENYNNINKIIDIDKIYISHIIYKCIINGVIFNSKKAEHFRDLSYYEDWKLYCNRFKTLFIDIDGTLVYNSGEYSNKKWGDTEQIKDNVDLLKELYKTGTIQIILTTARKKKYEKQTIEQLDKYSIPYDNILFDLYHCKRYLINDYGTTNPFPSAISINIARNNNNLRDYLLEKYLNI